MNTTVPRIRAEFEATIKVAGLTIAPGIVTGGTFPDEACVSLRTPDDCIALSPAEACALAAALQAVAVHQMEQSEGQAA